MFEGCSSLEEVDCFHFEHVKKISGMFKNCLSLKSFSFSYLNKENNFVDLDSMFEGCTSLKEVNFANNKFNKILIMRNMFKRMFIN